MKVCSHYKHTLAQAFILLLNCVALLEPCDAYWYRPMKRRKNNTTDESCERVGSSLRGQKDRQSKPPVPRTRTSPLSVRKTVLVNHDARRIVRLNTSRLPFATGCKGLSRLPTAPLPFH